MKLNNIRLLVEDFDSCFKFYREQVGLALSWGKPGGDYASFDIGISDNKMGLSIFKSDLMSKALGNHDKKLPLDCREKVAIVIQVESVDETFTALSGRGIEFVTKPIDMPGWGSRVAHFRDPEGNLIELCSVMSKEKWSDDLVRESREYEKE